MTVKTESDPFVRVSAPLEPHIASRILLLHEQRVMLDADLATLYGVETRVLVQAIKRNAARFPADFMFQLNKKEFANLRSQFVISSSGQYRAMAAVVMRLMRSPGKGWRCCPRCSTASAQW